jgi:hypothetical protein
LARHEGATRKTLEATLSHGRDAPPEYGLPVGIKVVTAEEWKTELLPQNILDRDARNPRARFTELCRALAVRKKIGCRDNHVWAARPT